VTNNLEALLTELYVFCDDYVVPTRRGRGRRPRLTDAELVTLAVAQALLAILGAATVVGLGFGLAVLLARR